jgi:hypothetical protein
MTKKKISAKAKKGMTLTFDQRAANQRAARDANRVSRLAPKANAPRTKLKEKKERKGPSPSVQSQQVWALSPATAAWASSVSNPMNGTAVKCPFNFNPVPSYLTMVVTTTATVLNTVKATAGQTCQMIFMPGHGPMNTNQGVNLAANGSGSSPDMDEVAYHFLPQSVNGAASFVNFGPGPSSDAFSATRQAAAFVYQDGITSGATSNNSNLGTYVPWDNPFPIQANPGQTGHMRWKMTAMGLRITNITPAFSRGGSVITVQPSTVIDVPTTQNLLALQPSFMDWGDGGEKPVEITWVPRMRDLAFWHLSPSALVISSGVATSPQVKASWEGFGIMVFLNAPAGNPQTYNVEVVAHWEVSGFSVQTLTSPSKATRVTPDTLNAALSAHSNNASTGHGFAATLKAAVGGVVTKAAAAIPELAVEGVTAAIAAAAAVFV